MGSTSSPSWLYKLSSNDLWKVGFTSPGNPCSQKCCVQKLHAVFMKSLSGISHTGLHGDKLGKSVHLIGRLCLVLLFNMFLLLYCLFIIPAKRYDYQADDCGVMVAVQQSQSCWWWCCHGTAWQQHLMTLSVRGQSSQQETHHVLVT